MKKNKKASTASKPSPKSGKKTRQKGPLNAGKWAMNGAKHRRIAELFDAGYKITDLSKMSGISTGQIARVLKSPHIRKYMEDIREDWKARMRKTHDRLLSYLEARVQQGGTEITNYYDENGKKISSAEKIRSFNFSDLLTLSKLCGHYQPTHTLMMDNKEGNEEEICEKLIKKVEDLEAKKVIKKRVNNNRPKRSKANAS